MGGQITTAKGFKTSLGGFYGDNEELLDINLSRTIVGFLHKNIKPEGDTLLTFNQIYENIELLKSVFASYRSKRYTFEVLKRMLFYDLDCILGAQLNFRQAHKLIMSNIDYVAKLFSERELLAPS